MRSIVLIACILFVGCDNRRLIYLPDVPQPPPAADAPVEMRLKNWIGVDQDGDRGGSCAHASTRNVLRAAGEYQLDAVWFQKASQGYEGPESADRLLEKLNREGILFQATEDGDVGVLETATRTGRWAVIFYYPSHAITFCGFYDVDGKPSALLLDNNFPDRYIVVEKRFFIDSWQKAYGGFAVLPWVTPIVPRTFPRTYRS